MAGIAGTEHLLKIAKNGVQPHARARMHRARGASAYEKGEHRSRKVWDYITCELDEQGVITPLPQDKLEKLQISMRLGRNKLRAIIDSAYKLKPKDKSEAAQEIRRRFASYADFDGIVFWAQLKERPASNGYRASNTIDFIVTPDLPDYPQEAAHHRLQAEAPPSRYARAIWMTKSLLRATRARAAVRLSRRLSRRAFVKCCTPVRPPSVLGVGRNINRKRVGKNHDDRRREERLASEPQRSRPQDRSRNCRGRVDICSDARPIRGLPQASGGIPAGRWEYFARSPGSDVWVLFGDLPDAIESALREKHKSKLAFPAGFPCV